MKNKNNKDNINERQKLLICIYTNKDKNEFAIGLKEDEHFRAMTKVGEFYTRVRNRLEKGINEMDCCCKEG